jgi:ribosomal protein S18 acetylase RimI-like enzyme
MKLRRCRMSDVDALLILERQAFKTGPLSRRGLHHFLISPNATFIVAENRGRLAGYVLVRYSSRHAIARVYSIAVHPDFRKAGLGARLLAAADKDAIRRRCRAIRLEVRKYARPAIRLYKRSGYRCFGEYPEYYEDRFSALRFEKLLDPELRRCRVAPK